MTLSPRERDVLRHAAAGLTVKETAHRMGCSPLTVKAYRESILVKMGTPNITAAAAYAERQLSLGLA